MKELMKKVTGVVMILSLIITSFCFMKGNDANAASVDYEVEIVPGGGSAEVKDYLVAPSATIAEHTYNNYMRNPGVSAEASSTIVSDTPRKPALAVDGDITTRWESEFKDDVWITADLGNIYSFKVFGIYWQGASASKYQIETSLDGINFESVALIESTRGERTDLVTFADLITTRFVRVHCLERKTAYGNSIFDFAVWGEEEAKDFIPKVSDLKVTSYAKYTGKYMIYFGEAASSVGYNVYIDNETEPIKTITRSGGYLTNAELSGYDDGEHTIAVTNKVKVGENIIESPKAVTTLVKEAQVGAHSQMPQIYINSGHISTEYRTNADVAVTVVDADGGSKGWGITDDKGTTPDKGVYSSYADVNDSACNIKIRGNTTADQPKKGWNIKFGSKTSVLGMPKGKKWNLLANSMDKSLMRNYLSYNFALENGVTYSSQSRYAEVYLNGVYKGNYMVCEPVEAKSNRVEIDAYDGENNDILLELGTRHEAGVDSFKTDVLTVTFDVNDPEKDDDLANDLVDAKIARVKEYLNGFETALLTHNIDAIDDYIDMDTFVDFYVVSELFKNQDFDYSSTRFYIKDDVLYAGPIWDLDLSSGNLKSSYYTDYYVDGDSAKGFKCTKMKWYKELIQCDEFATRVKERYEEMQYKIQSLYRMDSIETISINYLTDKFGASFARNYDDAENLGAGWPVHYNDGLSYAGESDWYTWDAPIVFLRDWLERRNIWLCGEYGIDMEAAYDASKPGGQETTTAESTSAIESTTATESTAAIESTTASESTAAPTVDPTAAPTVVPTAAPSVDPTVAPSVDPTVKSSETTPKVGDRIDPKQPNTKIKKITSKKKSLKIKLKRVKVVSGYQIQVATNKKFTKNKKNITTKSNKKITVIFKKLKAKKKYYIRVRTYKKSGGTTTYSKWSKKKGKTK